MIQSVYKKAVDMLTNTEADVDSDYTAILGLVLGALTKEEKILAARRITELENKLMGAR